MLTLKSLENKPFTAEKKAKKPFFVKKDWVGWLLLIPGLLLFGFFVWGPMVFNAILSFFNGYKLSEFVGFQNYATVFADPVFISALENTFKYILWSLIIGFFIPIILGICLSEAVHGQSIFRFLIYLPCVISGVAAAFLFKSLYDPEEYSFLNTFLVSIGLQPSLFASDPNLAIPLIVVAMTWRGAGGTVLIYLSAIQNIDKSQYEAVRLDGGGFFKRLHYVTFAQLRGTILTLLIMQIISVFQVFYEPMIIGSSNIHSISLMLLAYNYAFSDGSPELGATTSVILSLIIIACTIVYYVVEHFVQKRKNS